MHSSQYIPLVAHIIHRLDVGGLENGLINLINHMSADRYRHVIICMTDYSDFLNNIRIRNVDCYALKKKQGQDFMVYFRLWRLLRKLSPDIVHSRNIGTLECALPAMLSGVPKRIHGEHGRDMLDIDGSNRKYKLLRKVYHLIISQFIALSKDLELWLNNDVGIPKDKIEQIYNGVDLARFSDIKIHTVKLGNCDKFIPPGAVVIGTVGRLQSEKDQLTLIKAFVKLLDGVTNARSYLRLVLIGDGPLRGNLENFVKENKLSNLVWIAGARSDVAALLKEIDIFVLPSLGEGVSNTILEAMASKLPVIATSVGGNPELVEENKTGLLVPSADYKSMAIAIQRYLDEPELIKKHGVAGRKRVEQLFSIENMVNRYLAMYDRMLGLNRVNDVISNS